MAQSLFVPSPFLHARTDVPPLASPTSLARSLPLEEALEALLTSAVPVQDMETLPLLDCLQRLPQADIRATLPHPPFHRVQVDGYALRHDDIARASSERPIMLRVTQHVFAGSGAGMPLHPGEAARVTTGAMLPPGADCAVWQEDVTAHDDVVLISRPLPRHRNCRQRGHDIALGQTLIRRGHSLHPAALSQLAGQGYTHVRVFRRPLVGLLATGDELCAPGVALPEGNIYNASSTLLGTRVRALGADISAMTACGDNEAALRRHLLDLLSKSDVVITTGGVSGGSRDLLPHVAAQLVAELGGVMLFHGLRIKPGSLTMGMCVGGKVLLGLSGNPAPAAASFELLGVPLLKKLAGRAEYRPQRQRGIAQNDFGHCRKDTRRLVLAQMVGQRVFLRQHSMGAGLPGPCEDYNCFVDIAEGSSPLRAGMEVDVIIP